MSGGGGFLWESGGVGGRWEVVGGGGVAFFSVVDDSFHFSIK